MANEIARQSDSSNAVFVGRQPIFQKDLATYAYELLFRSSSENRADVRDGQQATAELILNAFTEIGLDQIVGGLPAFINVPEEFIVQGHCRVLPRDRVVIEVLEDVRPTPEVIAELRALKRDGFRIALDDFVYTDELLPLVELAWVVKVDLPLVPEADLAKHVAALRQYDLLLLAEKVETQEELRRCRELGFDLYQGFLFCKPVVVEGKRTSVNRAALMTLISCLRKPDVNLSEIADIVQTEPALATKLLRYVNSAYCGLSYNVDSMHHAVSLVGLQQIRTFCTLSTLAMVTSDKPNELVKTILTRAKMAELLAKFTSEADPGSFFTAGLFSALDVLLDLPMESALDQVPLNEEIKTAILTHQGRIGETVKLVIACEKADWSTVLNNTQRSLGSLRDAYLQAIQWTQDTLSESLISKPAAPEVQKSSGNP